jgi:hypothetical protein
MTESERIDLIDQVRTGEDIFYSILAMPESFESKAISQYSINHKVARNERLERIAAYYGTTRDAIVAHNNLVYPFIDSEHTAREATNDGIYVFGIAYRNNILLIPSGNSRDFVNTELSNADYREKDLGSDILMVRDDDECFDMIENATEDDVEIVTGKAAVNQAVQIKLTSRIGKLIDFPFYGLPITPGAKDDAFQVNFDRWKLRQSLLTDLRVDEALITNVSGENGKWKYGFKLLVRDQSVDGEM